MNNPKFIHQQILSKNYAGSMGGAYSAYYALAEATYGKEVKRNAKEIHKSPIEVTPKESWENICTLDPYGLCQECPTIGATKTTMTIPELFNIDKDGKIVNPDGSINCIKISLEQVWYLPKMASRLGVDESHLRKILFKYLKNPEILDSTKKVYLPPTGGSTIYIFGEYNNDPQKKVACRVHDECSGSDTFGTHICSCRPYLMYAVKECVKYAQKGNLGVIVYNRKEGRSLGEVIKFLVYNGRKNQEGGDRAETYFSNTESFANIRDARMQPLMPDTLLWLGLTRIDVWYSMSNEKSKALRDCGIKIVEQKEVPIEMIPKESLIELKAKISDGYYKE